MIQMLVDVAFLVLILVPVFILFVALYQNLVETQRLKQNIRLKNARMRPHHAKRYTKSGKTLPAGLRVIK